MPPGPAARVAVSLLSGQPLRVMGVLSVCSLQALLCAWKVPSTSHVEGTAWTLDGWSEVLEYGFHFISFHTSLSSQEETSFLGAAINSSVSLARTRHLPTSRPIPGKGEHACQAGLYYS